MGKLSMLRNYEKPRGYKYYNHFCTAKKGCYVLWSRDGKRYYLDGGINAKLVMPDRPFKRVIDAKEYLKSKLKKVM